jgi:hypothetical protein
MRTPPNDIKSVLWAAASQYGVPYTLLAAIAYRESQFNPDAVSPPNPHGQVDSGLFQLSPGTQQGYNVSNPLDATESARAASQMLVHLGRATEWNWKQMLWAYNYGPTAVAKLINEGKTPPIVVQQYADSVIGNRRWLQAQDSGRGSATPVTPGQQSLQWGDGLTVLQRLDRAIQSLARLNPQHAQAIALRGAWDQWFTGSRKTTGDAGAVEQPFVITAWNNYAKAYDRAPLTDSSTPTPALIEPALWDRVKDNAEASIALIQEGVNRAKAAAASVASWWYGDEQLAWLVLGGGAVLLLLSSRRGRRRAA